MEPITVALPQEPVADTMVVRFAPNTSEIEKQQYIEAVGGTITQQIDALDTVVVRVSGVTATNPLPESSIVAESEPDYFVSALIDVPTSDPHYLDQWALPVIGAPEAWAELPADAPMVTVAVIDSGICADHPDLQGRILPGYDFVEDDDTPQDAFGHGCGVAGIIAANADNGIGIAGVAPNAQILPLRVLDANGIGTYSDVAAAIVQATDEGAQIINLSLGGANPSTILNDAIDYAIEHDVLVIAAAGNTSGSVLYPAAYEPVIAVGSVDPDLELSSFSSRGPAIDLLAPGRDILTTTNGSGYATMLGTSFAAPHVTGVAVVENAFGSSLSINDDIVKLGSTTAINIDTPDANFHTPSPTVIAETTLLESVQMEIGEISTDLNLNIINESGPWAFGIAAISAPAVDGLYPEAYFFLARRDQASWQTAVEGTSRFQDWIEEVSDLALLTEMEIQSFSLSAQGDGSSQLNLPWQSGQSWNLTGGPHVDGFTSSNPNAWSALDFAGGDGQVRAARDGTAYRIICSGRTESSWVVINHTDGWRTSYYHLSSIPISTTGQTVGRFDFLGQRASNSTDALQCGGSWTASHLHFALLRNGAHISISGVDLGGWTIATTGSEYQGTMTRLSDGAMRTACASNCSGVARDIPNSGAIGSGGGTTTCNPNSNEISLHEHANYGGNCVIRGIGDYSNPSALGIANDSVSSIKVGSNVEAELCRDDNFGSTCETVSGDDSDLSNNSIGDNQVSSARVRYRNTGGNCSYNADQVALFEHPNYGGACTVRGLGDYPNPGSLGIANDSVSSIRVGGNRRAILCRDDNYNGTCETFTSDDSDLSNNGIGDNQVSSARVEATGGSGTWTARYDVGDTLWWNPNASYTPRCEENLGGPILDKNYGNGAPCGGMDGDNWVGVYESTINFSSGNYVLRIDHDDGVKVWWVNNGNQNIADLGGSGNNIQGCPGGFNFSGDVQLKVILREQGGDARIRLEPSTDLGLCPPSSPSLNSPANNITLNRYDTVNLAWNGVNGATEYYAEFWGGPSLNLNTGWTSNTSWFIGAQWGGAYQWRVRARNGTGESGWSETRFLTIKYGSPTNLFGTAASQTDIDLNWGSSADAPGNIDGYRIYRDGGSIGAVDSSTTTFADSGLTCETEYDYVVRSYNGATESDSSNTATVTTDDCPGDEIPPTVTITAPATGDAFNTDQLTVSAIASDADSGLQRLEFRLDYQGGSFEVLSDTDGSDGWSATFDITGAPDQVISFQADAYDNAGNTGSDTVAGVIIDRTPPTISITEPAADSHVSTNLIQICATGTDNLSGITGFQFHVGYDPELTGASAMSIGAVPAPTGAFSGLATIDTGPGAQVWGWFYLDSDNDGSDGWCVDWDVTNIADQEVAVYAFNGDGADNGNGTGNYGIKLDRTPPESAVDALPADSDTPVQITWSGTDNISAVGDLQYDVQYQTGCSGDWQALVSLTNVTTAQFDGIPGEIYCFRSRAYDLTGNIEVWPASPDTMTTILGLPDPVSYTSFDGDPFTLYPYEGTHIAFLLPATDTNGSYYDPDVIADLVSTFDGVYDFYQQATNRVPSPRYVYNGKLSIGIVPSTCGGIGSGCGYLGETGIELTKPTFETLYNGVRDNDEYDQALFYEFGRNFWFYSPELGYQAPDESGSIVTGYAVFMRFMAMDAVGVTPGPFNGNDFALFRSNVEDLLDIYIADPTQTWSNTLRVDEAPDNPMGLGASDLFSSFLMELVNVYGDPFLQQIWQEVDQRPNAGTTQDAVDNFIIASSITAGENLANLFVNEWKWPLSASAETELENLFGEPPLVAPTPIGPMGTVTEAPVRFEWSEVPGAEWYVVEVTRPDSSLGRYWFLPGTACPGGGTCSGLVNLSQVGDYSWQVNAYAAAVGHGPASAPTMFTLDILVLTAPTPIGPTGTVTEAPVRFEWSEVPGAEWYVVEVTRPDSSLGRYWFLPGTACPGGGTCSGLVNLSQVGDYSWQVNAYAAAVGHGPASAPPMFTLDILVLTAPTPMRPTGTETEAPVRFEWSEVPGAEWYVVEVTQPDTVVIRVWFQPGTACPGGGTCSGLVNLSQVGDYSWQVNAYAAAVGHGPASAPTAFTLDILVLTAPTPMRPTGTETEAPVRFEWSEVPGAEWYVVEVTRPDSSLGRYWFLPGTTCPGGGTCSGLVNLSQVGDYSWQVNAYAAAVGHGPASAPTMFTLDILVLTAPTPIGPTGTVTEAPVRFEWSEVPGAEWYVVEVTRPDSSLGRYWFLPGTACPGGGTCSGLVNLSQVGDYSWQVNAYAAAVGHGPASAPTMFMLEAVAGLQITQPDTLPLSMDAEMGVSNWHLNGPWAVDTSVTAASTGASWRLSATSETSSLTWNTPIALNNTRQPRLSFWSWLADQRASAGVQIRIDGGRWRMLGVITPTAMWQPFDIDLSDFRGDIVWVRFVWLPQNSDTSVNWYLDDIQLLDNTDTTPITVTPTPEPSSTSETEETTDVTATVTEEPDSEATVEVTPSETPGAESTVEVTDLPTVVVPPEETEMVMPEVTATETVVVISPTAPPASVTPTATETTTPIESSPVAATPTVMTTATATPMPSSTDSLTSATEPTQIQATKPG